MPIINHSLEPEKGSWLLQNHVSPTKKLGLVETWKLGKHVSNVILII